MLAVRRIWPDLLGDEVRDGRAQCPQDAGQVEVNAARPDFGVALGDASGDGRAGVREDGVQPPELLQCGRDQPVQVGLAGDVAFDGQGVLRTELRLQSAELVRRACEQDDFRTRADEGARRGGPDAAGSAGDQDDLVQCGVVHGETFLGGRIGPAGPRKGPPTR